MCIFIISLDYNPALFFIAVKSGLVGVLTVLSFAQLMPELLAAQYPLRFLDLYGMKYKAFFKLELSNNSFHVISFHFFSFLFFQLIRELFCSLRFLGFRLYRCRTRCVVHSLYLRSFLWRRERTRGRKTSHFEV